MISTSSKARLNGTARRAAAVALLAVTLPADGIRAGLRQLRRRLRCLARALQGQGRRPGHLARRHLIRLERRQLRPDRGPARSVAKVLQAELRAVLRPPRRPGADPPRPGPDAHACRHARPGAEALRRAARDHHRHLGPGNQLRLPTPAAASPSSARSPRWPTTAGARRSSPASCSTPSASCRRATCRRARCAAAGPARSARRSSCRRPT